MQKIDEKANAKEPLFNIPPLTFWLGIILFAFFGALQRPARFDNWVPVLSFIPAHFSINPFTQCYTVLTYALLHFGWPHIIMNITGLMAFGSGTEKNLGKLPFIFVFLGGVIFGALGHWLLFPHNENPLGGASAGISALFGAVLPVLFDRRNMIVTGMIFIVTNILLGMVGLMQEPGMVIAWQLHIFGFLFGLLFTVILLKMKHRLSEKQPIAPSKADES